MTRPAAAWLSAFAAIGLADWLLDRRHDGSTISECTRIVFATHTRTGRAVFLTTVTAAAAGFAWHIIATELELDIDLEHILD